MTEAAHGLDGANEKQEYVPQSILLTGGAGFIGSHVLRKVLTTFPDTKVVVLDNLSYCASVKNLDEALEHPNCTFVHGSITSSDLVVYVLEKEEVDTVLHFAAETHVDNSFGNSFKFTQTNVMGTHVLLEACKRLNGQIRRFIHVSTDEVYGESLGNESFLEESVLEPTNPYAASKAAAEFMVKAYHRSFKLPVIITRGNNVYGPNQYPEKIVPKFIHQMMRDIPLTVHGDGSTLRNMLFVSDVADAFITIVRFAEPGQTLNIGGSQELSVMDISSAILDSFGRNSEEGRKKWVYFAEDRKFNDTRYNIDNSKLLELGWKPKVDFKTGLQTTLEWYKAHPNHWGSIEHALAAHPRVLGEDGSHEPPLPFHHARHGQRR
mmetsp:Transcript_13674/g.26431  ORF Transcript_13674/g.26431 Transcript_13674/m.26431 type:complete len:378 (-) Transcript_13674:90-1223(-)|eukprot:CAMPEP_0171485592 /NCGR_PEP_ID=MMETSP0958-20121227/629_1 /TAXON_ID=87120 /ORGANISM="Aurantiochytrium limacinum, Strain ATCCMYA-1381" /LENGTH=377 /DNA_ID=CAMNT_0012018395 /DNA_START=80 /DNA_END=1213 /DNA_ORIENTATION=-